MDETIFYYFLVIDRDEIGVGMTVDMNLRSRVLAKFRESGCITALMKEDHEIARWLQETVEYSADLDGCLIRYGKILKGG